MVNDRKFFVTLAEDINFVVNPVLRWAGCGKHHFIQDNLSRSCGRTLRGSHYQQRHPQGKLVQVITGTIFDVAVDILADSPTYGAWVEHILIAEQGELMLIPSECVHGFYVPDLHMVSM